MGIVEYNKNSRGEKLSPLRLEKSEYDLDNRRIRDYSESPITSRVIEGPFQKEVSQKSLAIKHVNKTLCGLLCVAIMVAFVSYYFAMSDELMLNKLSRQITALNDENSELQNSLDRLKSFNNVDDKMMQNNMLTKAEKVIEVQAINSEVPILANNTKTSSFNWAIGY